MNVAEAILLKIDHALTLKDQKKLKMVIEETISELEAIDSDRRNSYINYLIGYCWYLHPDRQYSNRVENEVEKALLSAINQVGNFAKAWLYLGHNAYDFANYNMALKRFMNVDSDQLPPYLKLKTQEMIVCCKIHLEGLAACLSDLEKFVFLCEQYEPEDLWPQELARLINEKHKHLDKLKKKYLKKIAQQIDIAGNFGIWFCELIEGKH